MKKIIVGIFIVLVCGLGVYWWGRSTPLAKAQRSMDRGEPGECVEILVRALNDDAWPPKKEEAMRELLAKGYWSKGAMDSAEQSMRTLLEKFPHNFFSTMGLGVLNLLRDRGTFGVDYLEEAKQLDPKDIRPYLILGQYYSGVRDHQKAAANISAGLNQFPNNERLAELSGDLLFNQGRYQEALAIYRPLLSDSPMDRDLNLKIARSFLYSGDLKEASKIISSLRPSSGTDEDIELLLAQVYYQQGQRKKSGEIAERLYKEDNRRLNSGMIWAISLAEAERLDDADNLLSTIGEKLLPLGGGYSAPVAGQTFYDLERLASLRAVTKSQQIFYLRARANRSGVFEPLFRGWAVS